MSELFESASLSNDNLIYNPQNLATENITLLSGQNVVKGEVIGKVTLSVPTTGVAGSGNTGDAACGSVTGGTKTKKGIYNILCTDATNKKFRVLDPDGYQLPDAVLDVAYTHEQINFTITDEGTDPAAGDSFAITVAEGSLKYKKAIATSVDGSNQTQNLRIAANAINATSGDVVGTAYSAGEFNEREITIDSSYRLDGIRDDLRVSGITFKSAIPN